MLTRMASLFKSATNKHVLKCDCAAIDIDLIRAAIRAASRKYDVSPKLIAAVITQESSGNKWALRYENGFYLRYIARKQRHELIGHIPKTLPTIDTEMRLRAFSFGLMQIMGQVAREHEFVEDDLTRLLLIDTNIDVGTRFLAHCLKTRSRDVSKALIRYNGASNYPELIMQHLDSGAYKIFWNE